MSSHFSVRMLLRSCCFDSLSLYNSLLSAWFKRKSTRTIVYIERVDLARLGSKLRSFSCTFFKFNLLVPFTYFTTSLSYFAIVFHSFTLEEVLYYFIFMSNMSSSVFYFLCSLNFYYELSILLRFKYADTVRME